MPATIVCPLQSGVGSVLGVRVDSASASSIDVPVLFFQRSPSIAAFDEEQDSVPDHWHRGVAPGGAGPRKGPAPRDPHSPQSLRVPESWRGPAFAKPVGEFSKLPGASRRSNPFFRGTENGNDGPTRAPEHKARVANAWPNAHAERRHGAELAERTLARPMRSDDETRPANVSVEPRHSPPRRARPDQIKIAMTPN